MIFLIMDNTMANARREGDGRAEQDHVPPQVQGNVPPQV